MLPLLSPLLAAGQKDESRLPACCRRNGQHHCMMSMGERSKLASSQAQFRAPSEKCPYCPIAAVSVHADRWGKPETAGAIFAEFVSHPGGPPQTESKRRISRDRSRQKRGPPSTSLS